MKKNKNTILKTLFITGILTLGNYSYAQVRIANSTANQSASNSSAFIDASSNTTYNASSNVGKGLLFPRTDLTLFTAFGGTPIGAGTSYPNYYDGFVVYNTASSGQAGIGATDGTLTPGYWFYENKSGTTNGGTWKPIQNKSPLEGQFYYQRYLLNNVEGDWIEDFNTNIDAEKFTVIHVGSAFNRTLDKPNSGIGGYSCPSNTYVYKKEGTWRIFADYRNCTSIGGNGNWVHHVLIINNSQIISNGDISKNLNGQRTGSAPSPVQ